VARKLKTYVTSIGFFELAVAAPSMKAALEAWGTERNLFHQGFAKETDDPAIVAATMAQPGIVLKRSVGSRGAFSEHAELPKSLPADKPSPAPKSRPTMRAKVLKHRAPAKVVNLAEARAAKQAAAAFEKERDRRESERRKEESARTRQRAKLAAASAKAKAAMEKARQRHLKIIQEIEATREALDRRKVAEEVRWNKEQEKLEERLQRTRQ
jgi:flagellar biosynthesis GTPase FlhF